MTAVDRLQLSRRTTGCNSKLIISYKVAQYSPLRVLDDYPIAIYLPLHFVSSIHRICISNLSAFILSRQTPSTRGSCAYFSEDENFCCNLSHWMYTLEYKIVIHA